MAASRALFLRVVMVMTIALLCTAAAAKDNELTRANVLNEQLVQLYRQGRYADATPLASEALAIRELALGPEHPDVATSLNDLALLYHKQGRYADAEPLFKRSLAIWEKAFGPEHPHVASSLSNLAGLYQDQGRYADAEPLYKRSLAIREKALGPEHPDVASSLNNLAALYCNQGRYAEAEPLYKRSLAIWEKALGPEHPDVAISLNNLAVLYRDQSRYADAEPLYKRSVAIQEKALGPEHPNLALSLNSLAALYRGQGRDADAEPLYNRSVAIQEKALGSEHPNLATSLNDLALLYQDQGRYADAEPLYKRSLAIWEKAFGPEHPYVASSLNNLAGLYRRQGRYADAEPLYKRSLAIREKALGPEHPHVASSLSNLAGLYQDQGRYADAKPLYQRSLAIREKALGPEHSDVAQSLNNLALLYDNQGRFADAEPLYKRSLSIAEKALGREHPDVAAGLNNMALLYQDQGRYVDAESLYKRSLAIREKALGPEHPNVVLSLNNLAALYLQEQRTSESYALNGRAVDIAARRIATAGNDRSGGTGEQRQFRGLFLRQVGLAFEQDKGGDAAVIESFRLAQLASTSGAARAVAGMAARFSAGSDALAVVVREQQDTAQRWQRLDHAIVQAVSKPPAQRNPEAEAALRQQFMETGAHLGALEARIAREFPTYAELSNPKPLELAEAQALLAPDEAMLVYLVGTDETWLWTLRRDRTALYRIKTGAKALAAEVAALRNRLDPALNPDLAPFDTKRAFALYQDILAPAAPLLDGARQVFVAPDGALESLPLGVLVTQASETDPTSLSDYRDTAWFARDHALTVLPSVGALRALRKFASGTSAVAPFVGIGNPVLEGTSRATSGIKLTGLFRGAIADVAAVRQLPPLPETADELRAVAKAMGAGDGDLYLAERASEPLLRRAGLDRYRVVEFATHGLMSGDLAGLAEPALVLTPPREAAPDNDGLLTASKIATFKLNADWVVLSACNTAAGDGTPDAGGLSGLAKAFFYAGARSLLVSHWSVPSQATVKLVTRAFDELKKDPSIGRAEALRRAEMAMLDPANPPEFAHPMMWAPFVLVGEGGAGR